MIKKIALSLIMFSSLAYSNNDIFSDPKVDTISYFKTYDNNIKWTDYKSAYNLYLDKKNNKHLFIMVGSTTCTYCKIAKQKINENKELINYINENFIPIYINQDKDFIPVDLMVPGTPAFWVTRSNGVPLYRPIMGLKSVDELFKFLKADTFLK
jgi:thioredoxin-related protein